MENLQKTIMVVEDTESNIDMMMAILKEFDVIPATSGADALELLEEEKVDLILLDILMPEMDGFEVCRRLKSDPVSKDIPVIFITAKTDEESIEEAYEIGGIDYVTKPFKPRELLARVKTQLKLQNMLRELEFLATRDSLTGIYNRRKFFELAQQMYDRYDDVYAVMIDVDHFKRINDEYGHDAGDVALKKITTAIQNLLPKESIFGRMGGEEFVILMQCASIDQAIAEVEKARIAVSEVELISKNTAVRCTISNGIAHKGDNTNSLDGLLQEADAALYNAKNSGRNKAIFRGN